MFIRPIPILLVLLLVGVSVESRADAGALSAEGGAGMTALAQTAPLAKPQLSQVGGAAAIVLGGRYGVSNHLELTAWAFFEPPVRYYFNGAVTSTSAGSFPGTSTDMVMRYGGMLGARLVTGRLVRLTAGVDVGWSHRGYSQLQALNDSNPSYIYDYGLGLGGYSADNIVVSPVAGIEWAAGDHYSVSVLPRVEFLLGKEATWAVTVPLVFSWSWFL